ncbi:MAG: hypothetical protein H6Q58_385 [Firmicutes bacterium]|nr:hypothetical protein [Bacillota bacterium]
MTRKLEDKSFRIEDVSKIKLGEDGYSGEAIDRLGRFENMYFDLIAQQVEISKELEKLRSEGKTKTVRFKQLLTNKLTNSNILVTFEMHGLK